MKPNGQIVEQIVAKVLEEMGMEEQHVSKVIDEELYHLIPVHDGDGDVVIHNVMYYDLPIANIMETDPNTGKREWTTFYPNSTRQVIVADSDGITIDTW